MIAKRRSRLRAIHEFLREQEPLKCYYAIVKGRWAKPGKLPVKKPLRKFTLKSGERMVQVDEIEGKSAHSEFELLEQFDDCALVRVVIKTGRTHQIRVHAKSIGHPILNDDKYGDKEFNKTFNKKLGKKACKRLCLHARQIEVLNQDLKDTTVYTAEIPVDMQTLLDALA